jgi:hypothetical protein
MNFFCLLLVLLGVSLAFANHHAHGEMKLAGAAQLKNDFHSTKPKTVVMTEAPRRGKQGQLRTELSVELQSMPKVNGWYETVTYNRNDCTRPWYKDIYVLNTCGWSAAYNAYVIAKVVADTVYRYYTTTIYIYDSNGCDNLTSQYVNYASILLCNSKNYNHVIDGPLNPWKDNLGGFALGIFNSQTNCQEQNVDGLLEAGYQKLNHCWGSVEGDFMYTSCSAQTLVKNVYSSTDGSCTGTVNTYYMQQSDMCQAPDASLSVFGGYYTWVCENQK